MRTSTGFHSLNSLCRQGTGARLDQLILFGINIICDYDDFVCVTHRLTQMFHQGRFPRSYGSADSHTKWSVVYQRRIGFLHWIHDRNNLVYWVSWAMDIRSIIGADVPDFSSAVAGALSTASQIHVLRERNARWPSDCPSGIKRTPALTGLLALAWT